MAASFAPRPPPLPILHDLDVTIVSAKHLKNVNWRSGDLNPYVILWVDPDQRAATKPDNSGSSKPIWNERFVLPLASPPRDSSLSLEIFHSRPSEAPMPLVGTLTLELRDLLADPARLRSFEVRRPSGRPQGRISLRLRLIERPVENYQIAPLSGCYYSSPALPPPVMYSYSPPPHPTPPAGAPLQPYCYSDPRSGYCSSYYLPSRPVYERPLSYGDPGPSAPVDYTPYDYHRAGAWRPGVGMGTGLAVGALGGGVAGLGLEEGVKHEGERFGERVENDLGSASRNDRFRGYRSDY